MSEAPGEWTLWRVFPWDVDAADGEPFSVRSVAPAHKQTGGRFDLGTAPVLYLGEFPEHALAEVVRRFAGKSFRPALLRLNHHPLALVPVTVPAHVTSAVDDLGDPAILLKHGLRPDTLALPESEREQTQAISRALHRAGLAGFRWWSAIHGGWHSTILFVDHVPLHTLRFGTPEILHLEHPAVIAAAAALRMEIVSR